jgi:hypothetical protein
MREQITITASVFGLLLLLRLSLWVLRRAHLLRRLSKALRHG